MVKELLQHTHTAVTYICTGRSTDKDASSKEERAEMEAYSQVIHTGGVR